MSEAKKNDGKDGIKSRNKRKLEGLVVSDKSKKTIVVSVVRRYKDPLYSKFVNSTKKYHAHDEKSAAKIGDRVVIIESRPMSKLKRWQLLEIVQKGSDVMTSGDII